MECEVLCQRAKQQRTENGLRRVTGLPTWQKAKGFGDGVTDGEVRESGELPPVRRICFSAKKERLSSEELGQVVPTGEESRL
jgi:hypothetical protein